jgi:hypothetical protein
VKVGVNIYGRGEKWTMGRGRGTWWPDIEVWGSVGTVVDGGGVFGGDLMVVENGGEWTAWKLGSWGVGS